MWPGGTSANWIGQAVGGTLVAVASAVLVTVEVTVGGTLVILGTIVGTSVLVRVEVGGTVVAVRVSVGTVVLVRVEVGGTTVGVPGQPPPDRPETVRV